MASDPTPTDVDERALSTHNPSRELAFIDNAVRTFEGIQKVAEMMAKMGTLPVHLKDKPADCFRVVVQSAKWRIDPFTVAECTSLVHGRLCYEGKLVAAVLSTMNAIKGRLSYKVEGEGAKAKITVSGIPTGGDGDVKSITGTVEQWRTTTFKDQQKIANAWDKDPFSMLHYKGTRQWARLYAPEAMAGIYTTDEMEDIREVEGEVHGEGGTKEPTTKVGKTRRAPIEGAVAKDEPAAKPDAPAAPVKEQSLADAVGAAIKSAPAVKVAEAPQVKAPDLPIDNLKLDAAMQPPPLPTATIEECETAVANAWKAGYKKTIAQALADWKLNEVGELAGAPGSDRHDFIAKLQAMIKANPKGA